MILQKMAQAIRRQDWFQVVIEVLIVIVGIFLGLQVQAWYEESQNIEEEARLLEAMTAEVKEIQAIRNIQMETLLNEQEAAVAALAILFGEAGTENLTNRHCIGIRRSHSRSTAWNDIPITSIEEIVVSGKLNIIRDPEVRTTILKLRSISISVPSRIELVTSRDVILYSKYPDLIKTIFSVENDDVVFNQADCDFENIKLNSGFLNDFQANRGRKGALIRHASEELAAIDELLELVERR